MRVGDHKFSFLTAILLTALKISQNKRNKVTSKQIIHTGGDINIL